MYKKSICLFLFFLLATLLSWAQKYTVHGKIVNSDTATNVEYASVGILRADSTVVTGTTTKEDGTFAVTLHRAGNYILKVSFMGFQSHFQKITLSAKVPKKDVGTIRLLENDKLLGEAVVKTTLAKVEQKEDTTIFNASAYRVPTGSTLEALIKQLPGVEVSKDGAVSWNGKKINELLINGKDFFKGDNDIALKNLPSDLVSKIKAYDKKSDYTEQTGIDDGEEKAVLDISTKSKLDHSWVSNLDLGYGTHDRYSGNVFISRFTERSRVSAYGSMGNARSYGYGSLGGGLTSYKSGGMDFSWENDKSKKEAGRLELGGSASYDYSGTDMVSTSSSETFLSAGKSSSFSNNRNINRNRSENITATFRLEWHPDTMTSIRFRPNVNFSRGHNSGESLSATFHDDPYGVEGIFNPLDSIFGTDPDNELVDIAVNRNAHLSLGNSEGKNISGEVNLLRRLNSKGRNLNFRASGSYRTSTSRSFSISDIFYFNGKNADFLNQYSMTPTTNWNYLFRLGYAEPITDKWVAEARYSYGFKYSDSDRSRYNLDELGGMWNDADHHPLIGQLPSSADSLAAVRDLQNSQYATYKYYDHNVDLSLQYKTEKVRLNLGVEFNPEKTKMAYNRPGQHIDTVITRDVFQVIPDARFRYRFSSMQSFDVRYRGYASQPSMTNLLAVVDNSNPLSVSMGNPGLKPSWTNTFSLGYSGYNAPKQQGIYSGADFTQTGRSVSNLLVYDETTGVRYMRPENIDGNWRTSGYVMFNTGIGKEKNFSVSTYSNVSYDNSVGYVSSFASTSKSLLDLPRAGEVHDLAYYDDIFNKADIKKNKSRTLLLNERLNLSYRKNWLDVGVHGGVNYNHSTSTVQERSNMDTWVFDYGVRANLNFDCGFALSTDIKMNSRRGFSDAAMNTNELLWNAQLSYSFLAERAATVSMQFRDILQNQSNISRRVDAMMRSDSWTNAIYSYCMLHFIYKLNIFPGQKSGKANKGKSKAKYSSGHMPMMMHSRYY